MGTGQMLLALAAMAILSGVTISANTLILNRTDLVQGSEAVITGTALGQALVEDATVKCFDQKVLPPLSTDTVSVLTLASDLGIDSGEVAGNPVTFNDLDDYNGYTDSVETPRIGYFWRSCRVYYVTATSPDVNAGVRTFLKRIDVTVTSPYITLPGDSIRVSKIVSYRYKK